MAYEGEIVRMENGRWARFQRCLICNAGHQDTEQMSILVAVELEERFQDLLRQAEGSLEQVVAEVGSVDVSLKPDDQGKPEVRFERRVH